MENIKMLSGYEIVAKGATKIEATLPELGLKDIFPNRTWLEDKQIQAAIESRKQLIEIERINKSGLLSYAEWREDMMLAEVTQQVGSYWQYLGHNNGKNLYLRPEEALFLLEINNLCLKHNNVIVSLQQAYSLLLRDRMSLLRYKVYASLSRLGFRVFRHKMSESRIDQQPINMDPTQIENQVNDTNNEKHHESCSELHEIEIQKENTVPDENKKTESSIEILKETSVVPDRNKKTQHEASITDGVETTKTEEKTVVTVELHPSLNTEEQSSNNNNYPSCSHIKQGNICTQKKLQKLRSRQLIPCNSEIVRKYFEKVPELLGNQIITVKAPDKQLLPKNVVLNNASYKVNLQNIQNKGIRHSSTEVNVYNANEVNGSHIRRIRNVSNRSESNWIPPTGNVRFVNQNIYFRPFHYWRPRRPFNYHNINMYPFQRAFIPGLFFNPNLNVFPRPQPVFYRPNFNNNFRNIYNEHNRKIMKKIVQKEHLEGILKLADQLKQLIINGDTHQQNINALQILIQTYNTRYKTKLRLNERFDLVIDETITDTIELDDDDEGPSAKKRRINDSEFEDNLNNIKLFAQRLKTLECNDKSSGRHRRAFSKLIKTFNKSYNEDYYLNEEYEVVYRNQIDLDTSESSDLDCIDPPNFHGKKLRNPFNIMKRFSEYQNVEQVNASSSESSKKITLKNYSPMLLKTFTKEWLPGEDDFGRAEVVSDVDLNEVNEIKKEEFLYDFIKIQTHRYDNWLGLKKSFYKSIQAAISEFQNSMPSTDNMEMNSMVKPEDCANMASVLQKLSIIKTFKETRESCNVVEVDFDVYERAVQNFKKSNRPKPHFRLICIEESTDVPSGDEIAALHAKYNDGVSIVFALVNIKSISYIQINPTDLPMYISS